MQNRPPIATNVSAIGAKSSYKLYILPYYFHVLRAMTKYKQQQNLTNTQNTNVIC